MGILRASLLVAFFVAGCQTTPSTEPATTDAKTPIVTKPWDMVRIGTYANAEFARLFTEIGGYSVVSVSADSMVLQKDEVGAKILLEQMPEYAPQARPPAAKSWEPGCYWSLMMRAKDVPSIVEDAEALGWLPKTPVAYLEFGPSKLNVVVLTHQETGMQVQLYERLTTPLPEDYPDFERFGIPFNIMQMASDRDATYQFFTEEIGFATWYHGDPFVSEKEEVMPLGIPVELTTTVPYRASIVSPVEGMETGRFEMIEVMGEEAGLTGRNFSETCTSDAVGLTDVLYTFETDDFQYLKSAVQFEVEGDTRIYGIRRAPDGARIAFLPHLRSISRAPYRYANPVSD